MEYNLELQFSKLNADLCFANRYGSILKTDMIHRENTICVSTNITLPNKIIIEISKTREDFDIKLIGVWLGGIKFNNQALKNLFVYHHPYGQSRSCDWNFGGKVEFDFFEASIIKYHLVMRTII